MTLAIVGGTFSTLHIGHRELIGKAFEASDRVLVCITSDAMASVKRGGIPPYAERREKLRAYLEKRGLLGRAELVSIDDPFSEGMRPDVTHIVVSPATRKNAEKINSMRKRRALPCICIVEVPFVLARDGRPISDRRILDGEIDGDGETVPIDSIGPTRRRNF